METRLHAVERVPAEGRGRAAQFIPIRFIYRNKLTQDDRLLLAFDAFVLAAALGREIALGKIIHGDAPSALPVDRGCARESAANLEVGANEQDVSPTTAALSRAQPRILSTLSNCRLSHNSALYYGGGAAGGTLNNCTVTRNSAGSEGGGASFAFMSRCTLYNCIVYFNTAPDGANYSSSTLNYCCTTPLPANGVGNITNAPLFVDDAAGNLRLQSNSPCINAGLNAYAPGTTDLDGNPRIVSGTVDIGAYEFQGPGSTISYAWLQHYGLPTDGSADAIDTGRRRPQHLAGMALPD